MFGFTKNKTADQNKEQRPKIHILCVCGAGLGSSMIVELTTQDALNELGVSGKLEHDTISAASGTNAEIILTGENFRPQFEKFSIDANKTSIVYLKNLTSKTEISEKLAPILKMKGLIEWSASFIFRSFIGINYNLKRLIGD